MPKIPIAFLILVTGLGLTTLATSQTLRTGNLAVSTAALDKVMNGYRPEDPTRN